MKNRTVKSQNISVNLSTPIVMRTRCSYCGKTPEYFFRIKYANYYKNIRTYLNNFEWIRKYHKRMCNDNIDLDTHMLDSIYYFAYYPTFKSYSPRTHMCVGVHPFDDKIETIICSCGRSRWSFYFYSAEDRPEIVNRKSKNFFPNKISY